MPFLERADRHLLKTRRNTRLYIKDLFTYVARYVYKRFQLRIEEVVTLDNCRLSCSMSQALERYHIFDENVTCIATKTLLEKRLIYRLYDWDKYTRHNILADVRLLRSVARDRFPITLPYTPKSFVMLLLRAEFRVMYFVHGRSTTYNYKICSYMFHGGSEATAVVDGELVRVRPLHIDDEDNETFLPLFSRDLSVPVINAVRLLWFVANGVPEERVHDDDESRALRHLITIYATWAYTYGFLNTGAPATVDMEAFARRCFVHYRSIFTVDKLRMLYREAINMGEASINFQSKTVSAQRVTDAFITDPPYIINSVTRLSVDIADPVTFRERVLHFVRENIHVIPASLIFSKSKDLKGWVVVKRDDDRQTMIHGTPLTTAYIRDILRQERQECRTSRRRNIRSPTRLLLSPPPPTSNKTDESSSDTNDVASSAASSLAPQRRRKPRRLSSSSASDTTVIAAPSTPPQCESSFSTVTATTAIATTTTVAVAATTVAAATATATAATTASSPAQQRAAPRTTASSGAFTVTHDKALLLKALSVVRYRAVITNRELKQEKKSLFQNFTPRNMNYRIRQMVFGRAVDPIFAKHNATDLMKLRKRLRHLKK